VTAVAKMSRNMWVMAWPTLRRNSVDRRFMASMILSPRVAVSL
jgi:hypothetical protein